MEHPFKKILITGIDGFTGIHLKKQMEDDGFDVIGTSLHSTKGKLHQLDIMDTTALKSLLFQVKPNYIIHLAAISFVGHKDFKRIYEVNTIGVETLLKTVADSGLQVDKILIPSSATVYGNQNTDVLSENLKPAPNNHYGCSKLSMEFLTRNFFSSLPIIITRPFNYTGRFQSESFLIPKIVNHYLEKRRTIELGNISVFREFNDVEFICEVYKRLIFSSYDSIVVNVCSGVLHSISEIIETLDEMTNHKIEVVINEQFVRKNEIAKLSGSTTFLSTLIKLPPIIDLKAILQKMLI